MVPGDAAVAAEQTLSSRSNAKPYSDILYEYASCCLQAALVLPGDAAAVAEQLTAALRPAANPQRFAGWSAALAADVSGASACVPDSEDCYVCLIC